jgi:DNA-binding IclR family transcriptional regulator
MPRKKNVTNQSTRDAVNGPRAILRVPDVLLALASMRGGGSLAELSVQLAVPKTSLHRLLRTLERGGYLAHATGLYSLGPASFRLADLVSKAAPSLTFPACARPVIEWLAHETHETVMLGVLSEQQTEVRYVDVIDSTAPVRFTVPVGDRRPLFSAASGKALLAFLSPEAQKSYLSQTAFMQFTSHTTRKAELPGLLREIRKTAIAVDRSGRVEGATGIASPVFDRDGDLIASVSVAGPTERMDANREHIESLVREAGERISTVLGCAIYPVPRNDRRTVPKG